MAEVLCNLQKTGGGAIFADPNVSYKFIHGVIPNQQTKTITLDLEGIKRISFIVVYARANSGTNYQTIIKKVQIDGVQISTTKLAEGYELAMPKNAKGQIVGAEVYKPQLGAVAGLVDIFVGFID